MNKKPSDLNSVFIFKLLNGETIIAFLVEDRKNGAIVYKPLEVERIDSVDNENEEYLRSGVLVPWILSTTSEFHFVNKSHIVAVALPNTELLEIYIETINTKNGLFDDETNGFDNLSKFNEDDWWKRN
jgi:hypothetical protein